jgi:hypothetical protein
MGLKVNNTVTHALSDNINNFFSLPIEDEFKYTNSFDELKTKIYELDIDNEEKADVLNAISKYNSSNSAREKKKIEREINEFVKLYKL